MEHLFPAKSELAKYYFLFVRTIIRTKLTFSKNFMLRKWNECKLYWLKNL